LQADDLNGRGLPPCLLEGGGGSRKDESEDDGTTDARQAHDHLTVEDPGRRTHVVGKNIWGVEQAPSLQLVET
jgi:hypothetical protein